MEDPLTADVVAVEKVVGEVGVVAIVTGADVITVAPVSSLFTASVKPVFA